MTLEVCKWVRTWPTACGRCWRRRGCGGATGSWRDALNPVIDALRRNGSVEFVHVRHEEYGVFAAVAEARLTGNPVAVCGTAGPDPPDQRPARRAEGARAGDRDRR